MKLSGAAWSFVGTTLHESVAIYRALGITTVDLIAIPDTTLDSLKVIQESSQEAEMVKELNVSIANIIFSYAPNFYDRALNHPDPQVRRRNVKEFYSVVDFCWRCSIPSITVVPGITQKGWSRKKALAVSAEILNELAEIANQKGILLLFEAHVGSVLESPIDTLNFLEANPRLKLTLDYSHFVYSGYSQEEIDPLAAFAGHVHLRQGAQKVLQARWEKGVIDFTKVLLKLQESKYAGYLTIEYEHDNWLNMDRVDVVTETIKMRNLVRSVIS